MHKLAQPYSLVDVPVLITRLVEYGYLGVDVFFVISGIVISRSAIGRSWGEFGVARFGRLYPSYLVATIIAIFIYSFALKDKVGLSQDWLSLTGLQWFFGYPTPVGPAWTLFIEVRFYLLISFLLAVFGVGNKSFLMPAAKIWLLLIILAPSLDIKAIHFLFITEYGCYFVFGMLLGLCSSSKEIADNFFAILIAFVACLVRLSLRIKGGSGLMSLVVAFCILSFMFFLVIWSFQEKYRLYDSGGLIVKLVTLIALMSYPLYLLHEPIGMPLIGMMHASGFGLLPAFLCAFILVSLVSWICVSYIEPGFRKLLNGKFRAEKVVFAEKIR